VAKFYATLACGGAHQDLQVIAPDAAAAMAAPLTNGFDRVLRMDTAFSTGVMQDPLTPAGEKARFTFGPSLRAFGQPGAGGNIGFADPDLGLGFGARRAAESKIHAPDPQDVRSARLTRHHSPATARQRPQE
jgi:hypothetical protein